MKEQQKIRPEWIPSAYKDEKPEVSRKSGAAKAELTAPLYIDKKPLLKQRVGSTRKKP